MGKESEIGHLPAPVHNKNILENSRMGRLHAFPTNFPRSQRSFPTMRNWALAFAFATSYLACAGCPNGRPKHSPPIPREPGRSRFRSCSSCHRWWTPAIPRRQMGGVRGERTHLNARREDASLAVDRGFGGRVGAAQSRQRSHQSLQPRLDPRQRGDPLRVGANRHLAGVARARSPGAKPSKSPTSNPT